jgi:hypothetical protein
MRIRRLLLATLVVALGLAAVPASPASAFEGERIVLRAEEGNSFTHDYGAMPVPDTAGARTEPGDCALSASCTEIPMTVELPASFDPDNDEFFFSFKAEWEGNVDLAAAGSQDLDIYFYTLRKNEEGEDEYVEVGSAATADEPERTRLFNLTEGEYVITVINFLGVNTGFRLSFDYVDVSLPDGFDPYDGAKAGGFAGGGRSDNDASDSSDAGGSSGSADSSSSFASSSAELSLQPVAPSPSSPSTLAGPGDSFDFGLAATPGDAGLGDFGSFNQFQKDLNAEAQPSSIDLLAASRRKLGPAADVGAPVLVFWLLLAPLVLGGFALAMVIRRRPAALTLST